MKCPNCGKRAPKDYVRCRGCGRTFVFASEGGITDEQFVNAVKSVSQDGTRYFTKGQLVAMIARQREARRTEGGCGFSCLGVVVAGLGIGSFFALSSGVLLPVGVVGLALTVGLVLWLRSVRRQNRNVDVATVERWVDEYERAEPMSHLVASSALHAPPPAAPEPDVYDYGVERILIVEHDHLVDLLVKNGDHAELRALVLSESGYPSYLVDRAKQLLFERPDLPVVLLHDASPRGREMNQRLQTSGLLPIRGRHITDAGLFPEQLTGLGSIVPGIPSDDVRVEHIAPGVLKQALVGVAAGALFATALAQAANPGGGPGTSDFG